MECRPYLAPPGVDGSASWDHCEVVNIMLKHDAKLGGKLATYMVSNGLAKSAVWKYVQNTLRRAGFDMANGRMVGVLEHKPADSE